MKPPFHNRQLQTMLAYFSLALVIIIAYKFIMEINVFLGAIKWFFKVISPFISGFLLAYVLNIPCGGIQQLLSRSKFKFINKKKKSISIITVYLLLALIIFLILRMVVPYIYNSVTLFADNFSRYYDSAQDFISYINNLNILNVDISIDEMMNAIREFSLQKLPSSINAIVSISSGIFSGFLAFISSIYILAEKENFKKYLNKLASVFLSKSVYDLVMRYTKQLNTNFKQYIYTQTVDGFILGSIATIELVLLKSPYAVVLGIMLGIVNYIPYFGSIFGSLFVVLIVAFTQSLPIAVITAIILLITQQIDANIIQPRLMSGSFSLSPLIVIIGITIGGAVSGMIGMVAAIPIIAVVKNILDEVIAYYEKRKTGNENQ